MKKSILLVVLFALVSVGSFAQVSPVVKGSLNLSNYYGGDSDGSKTLVGGRFGFGIEYQFNDLVSLQPTLYLSHKGAKYGNDNANVKFHEWYLDMPIDVQLRFNIADNTNLTVAAGPYIAYGIFGKTKGTGAFLGNEYPGDVDTFGDNRLKRFDAGLNFELGFEFGKFLVGGSYELGLVKPYSDSKCYNSNFSINVGYKF